VWCVEFGSDCLRLFGTQMSFPVTNKQWLLVRRPVGDFIPDVDLKLETTVINEIQEGEILVQHILLSVDPTNRIWMSDAPQYLPIIPLGSVMRSFGVGRVVASKNAAFKVGDWASAMLGWQQYCVLKTAYKLPVAESGLPADAFISLISFIGFTAYFGLKLIEPQAGQTLVVDAAAGAVGSLVGQLGKIFGLHVVGIAGGAEKCALLRDLGFDAAIDYKSENVGEALRRHCPKGIDLAFENVGGDIMDEILLQMNRNGRISVCGLISGYNSEPSGPKQFGQILMKRLTVKGFIVLDFESQYGEASKQLIEWYKQGKLRYISDIRDQPIEQTPHIAGELFNGKHGAGKLFQILPHDHNYEVKLTSQ